ncbi:hypothetical protein GCM10023321_03610 [Pseudonocardia eucalypti]|uniref:Glycosyltransferase 2-like domain-containing protein n=1 Tax=Pseudonocardia eucalypti TaxID=648755 RepID=A0ABP9PLC3_9PSEU
MAPVARGLLGADGALTVTDATSAALARRLLDAGVAHPAGLAPAPADPNPADPNPADPDPADPNPADLDRTDSDPAEPDPAEPDPADLDRTDPNPMDSNPAEPDSAEPDRTSRDPADPDRTDLNPRLAVRESATRRARIRDSPCTNPRLAVPESATHRARIPDSPGVGAVTVVVPVRDRGEGVRRLVAAVRATAAGVAEVIVVDDGSVVPVVEAGARVIRHGTSLGPAAARNTGLAAARTEFVAFLDSDVTPEPGWLAPLLELFADPSVALAAPRIVAGPDTRYGWLARYEQTRSALDLGPEPGPIVPLSRIAYVPSAAMVVRRRALHDRGFDPELRVAEDVDLVLRLHSAGWRMRYQPAARVAHRHRVALKAWWTRKAFYGTGAAALAIRHPGSVPPAVLAPWAAGAAALLIARQDRYGALGAAALTGLAATKLRRTAEGTDRPNLLTAYLVARGVAGAAGQVAGLLNRHWWPLTVLGCLASKRIRRAALLAALAEGAVDWYRHRGALDPVRYLLAHRADDLGYGAGLWWGAWRRRTAAPLLPVVTGPARKSGHRDQHERGAQGHRRLGEHPRPGDGQ